jgi:hypothetical protein
MWAVVTEQLLFLWMIQTEKSVKTIIIFMIILTRSDLEDQDCEACIGNVHADRQVEILQVTCGATCAPTLG